MAPSARRRKQGAENSRGSLHMWLCLHATGPARHYHSPAAALSSLMTPGPSGLSPSLPACRRSCKSWKQGSSGNDAAAQDRRTPGSSLTCLCPSLLQTLGLEGRCLCSPAGPESWLWQRGAGISFPAPQRGTSPGTPGISIRFSQLGVRVNQPSSWSAMPCALGKCHCGFGHTCSETPNPAGLAASMPETRPVPRPHLAPSAAPWDMWLGKMLDPSVSP